jgi:hypothetical protein
VAHPVVQVLVLVHLVAIISWSLPNMPRSVLEGRQAPVGSDHLLLFNQRYVKRSPLGTYLITTGAWQYWDMFAPNPSRWDGWADAVVVFADGTEDVFRYPRMKDLSIPEKYLKERYRKFYERAGDAQNSWLWPRFAQRIALEEFLATGRMPTSVRLRKHERIVQPPGKPQLEYSTHVYYTHVVDQDRVRREARP